MSYDVTIVKHRGAKRTSVCAGNFKDRDVAENKAFGLVRAGYPKEDVKVVAVA